MSKPKDGQAPRWLPGSAWGQGWASFSFEPGSHTAVASSIPTIPAHLVIAIAMGIFGTLGHSDRSRCFDRLAWWRSSFACSSAYRAAFCRASKAIPSCRLSRRSTLAQPLLARGEWIERSAPSAPCLMAVACVDVWSLCWGDGFAVTAASVELSTWWRVGCHSASQIAFA